MQINSFVHITISELFAFYTKIYLYIRSVKSRDSVWATCNLASIGPSKTLLLSTSFQEFR